MQYNKHVASLWDLRFSRWWGWWWSGFWRHADSLVDANVSQKHTVSIFSPQDKDRTFFWNVGIYQWVYMVPKFRRTYHVASFIRSEAFTVTACNKVFSGDQLCKYEVTIQNFGDCLCSIKVDVTSDMTACCICTHDWLSEPCVLVCEQANRSSGW
jgi:hypothetical protein